MRLLRLRTGGKGIKDGQGSWTPLLAQATPGNARQYQTMDSGQGPQDIVRASALTSRIRRFLDGVPPWFSLYPGLQRL
jgi:hypothetical protein